MVLWIQQNRASPHCPRGFGLEELGHMVRVQLEGARFALGIKEGQADGGLVRLVTRGPESKLTDRLGRWRWLHDRIPRSVRLG